MPTREYEIMEESSGWFTLTFYDRDGLLATPASIDYYIRNLADGAVVRASTPLTPDTSVDLQLTPSDTEIVDDTKQWEAKRVTVEVSHGVDDAYNQQFDYHVKNLSYIT
jgi:hypothetical protein